MNLNSILIGSEDPQRLAAYYTGLFGKPEWEDGPYTGWRIGTGGMLVGPHDGVNGANMQPGRIIWNIESSDVQADFDRLKAAGGIVITAPYVFQGENAGAPTIATFADPDGNYFQLMSPMTP